MVGYLIAMIKSIFYYAWLGFGEVNKFTLPPNSGNLSKFGCNCATTHKTPPQFVGLERKSLGGVCEEAGQIGREKGACARGTHRWLRHPHLGTGSVAFVPAASSLTFSHLTCCWTAENRWCCLKSLAAVQVQPTAKLHLATFRMHGGVRYVKMKSHIN